MPKNNLIVQHKLFHIIIFVLLLINLFVKEGLERFKFAFIFIVWTRFCD